MTSITYDSFFDDVFNARINPATDTFNAMLVTSAYVPNKGTHTKRSDVTNEVVGTGYTSGGKAVAATIVKDTTNHKNQISFANPSWPSSTITAHGAVIFKSTGTAANDPLVAYVDFGTDASDTNGTFTATFTAPLTIQN